MGLKKAAYVATVYSHINAFHLPFLQDLREKGCEVHVYACPDHTFEDVRATGVDCRSVPFSRSPFSPDNVRAFKQLKKAFESERYDLVHVHTPNASVICRLAARFAGLDRIVYTAHGFHFFKGAPLANWLLYYPVERLMARWTDALVTINREDYERASTFPLRGEAVYMPGVGIDLSRYRELEPERLAVKRKELGIAENDFVLLCVAELNGNKNQTQLLRSVRQLKDEGVPVKAILAGTGDSEELYRRLAEELGVREETLFLGFRKDVPELINIADVLVLLSRREGLPKALLEAIGIGRPMVVTNVRGSADLVRHGENGFIVPIGDVPATTEALLSLHRDPAARLKMGANGKSGASQYDLQAIQADMRGLYERLRLRKERQPKNKVNEDLR
ncbi:glycosyltransferase family 4 protein [Paenibacillus sp. NPDC058071]|uniref:glycosyltransferase family 4 protein n=1 Tax=Paenibacillus sp. NPDC058071 TaxID=3346326 RepID=UPI0036D99A2B